MKGRSRLDRYQNLRNGMTPNEFTSEDNQLDNNALNNNSAIDSYRSRLNQNINRTSNYGNGANSRNGLYQTSDYSRLLQEHEEFLRSLDENFGVLNDEVTTQVNNRIENQRPQRVEEVRPQMTAYPHSGYQPHYAAEQPVYQQPEQQPQQPIQTFEQVIDQVVEQITKPVEEEKEAVKEIIEPVVEQPVEEPKFVIQPKEVKTVDKVNQTTTPSVSPTYVATVKPVEKPVIEEPKYVIQPKEVKTVDKANQNVTHTVSPTYVTPVKKVEKPVIEEPKYVIQPKEVKGVDSNYIPAHAEKTEQEPTVSKVEKVELPEPTPEIDVAPLTDFTPHVAPLAEVNQLEDFPEEEYLQPELEPASEPEVTEEVTPIIMPVLKPVEEVNEVVEETEETVEEVLGETSDYVEDIVKELEQQIDEQPEQENSEPAVEENSEPVVEEETVEPAVEEEPTQPVVEEETAEPAVEEEPTQPVVEEENTEPVAEEEYHEPAVEEERTHELPDWIEEEHEDGYVLFTNKDMPHMGFEDEEESAQSLEEVSEKVFEKALDELPEGVEEEHEDGYVLFTNKEMPHMGFEDEEETAEPAVEEESTQPVVEEDNTEPVAEEEYHEPAVEEERTHKLPDWIDEEHEDGYVLFTNKDMPHMGFEDEEESAQSLEEVSEKVFEKALDELPEGVEEEHEDGYVLFTNKDMPRMGFEEEPEEVSEPEETSYQKPPISIVYGENYGDNYDPYGLGEDTREEDEHKDFLLPDLDEEELQPELTAEEPVEQPETEPVMPEETVIEEPETVIEAEPEETLLPEETQLAEENQLTEENEKMVFSLEDDIPDLISEELTAEDDIDIDSTLLQLESLKNTHQQPKVEEENINVDEISEEVSKAAEETYDFGEDDESRQVFDYIDDSLDYVDSLGNDDHNPLENTQTNFMLDDESSVDDITSAISQMDLDSYTFSDNDDEYRPQAKMQADLAYQPNNQIDQPLYYDDPEKVNELTEKLNNERELREEILEQTKQLKLQMSEYENEINDANTSMSKTNKILNFVLTLLILLLFVFLLVIGYWFAQERGLI